MAYPLTAERGIASRVKTEAAFIREKYPNAFNSLITAAAEQLAPLKLRKERGEIKDDDFNAAREEILRPVILSDSKRKPAQ